MVSWSATSALTENVHMTIKFGATIKNTNIIPIPIALAEKTADISITLPKGSNSGTLSDTATLYTLQEGRMQGGLLDDLYVRLYPPSLAIIYSNDSFGRVKFNGNEAVYVYTTKGELVEDKRETVWLVPSYTTNLLAIGENNKNYTFRGAYSVTNEPSFASDSTAKTSLELSRPKILPKTDFNKIW